jgi:hypothetical protein
MSLLGVPVDSAAITAPTHHSLLPRVVLALSVTLAVAFVIVAVEVTLNKPPVDVADNFFALVQ